MADPIITYIDKEGKSHELEVDEEETTLDSMPKADALRFTDVIREQIEKSGVKNLEFTHTTNQDSLDKKNHYRDKITF